MKGGLILSLRKLLFIKYVSFDLIHILKYVPIERKYAFIYVDQLSTNRANKPVHTFG